MRIRNLIRTALNGLWRQKTRTILTTLGVAIGACALVFGLSLGLGLRAMIDREFRSKASFWQVHIRPTDHGPPIPVSNIPPEKIDVPGAMTEERRQRIRQRLIQNYQSEHPTTPKARLSPDTIARIAQIPNVTSVETWHNYYGRIRVGEGIAREGQVVSGKLDRPALIERLVAGRMHADMGDEILVSEFFLYELGFHDDAAFASALGQPLHLSLGGVIDSRPLAAAQMLGLKPNQVTAPQEKILGQLAAKLPAALAKLDLNPAEREALKGLLSSKSTEAESPTKPAVGTYHIVGIVRNLTLAELESEQRNESWEMRTGDVLIPTKVGEPLFAQIPRQQGQQYRSAVVNVEPGSDLRSVIQHIEAEGLQHYSAIKWYENAKREVTLIAAGLNLFALVSLLVASLGITNTLATTVVERTREIGILKAVGATRNQIMLQFLAEGTVIGMLGGLLGMLLAWGLSFPGDGLVRKLVQEQAPEKLVTETVFEFPVWLIASTILFAATVTTLAAVIPARRAARLQPVDALRAL
jgi:putative ABC transport system permease protein